MHIIIALSWFHRKVGPVVFYYYPEGALEEDQKIRIADQIDQAFDEGFFSHSFDNLISMNYYFEIFSKWARGQREMLMISAVFDGAVPSDIEHEVLAQCIDFARRLRENKDIYKAFYSEEDPQYSEESQNIKKYNELIRVWVKELYWTTIEITREKSEEEIIAQLMSQKSVYDLIRFLSHGPVSLEDLQFWFEIKFPEIDLNEILNKLEHERIIFINDIGVENYVLLVKKISVQRIPPDCVISLFEEKPELEDLTQMFWEKVQDFFDNYEPTSDDSQILFELVADSKIYNLLSQLRTGPIPKTKLTDMVSANQLNEIFKNLDLLKKHEIIDEFEYRGEILIILKTDIRFTRGFPDYLKALIPKETKDQVAKSYSPKRTPEIHVKTISLEEEIPEDTDTIFDFNENEFMENFGKPNGIFEDLKILSDSLENEPQKNQGSNIKVKNTKKKSKKKRSEKRKSK